MKQEAIILFDGVCNFCNSTVNFVIKRDKNEVIHYATLQSEAAQKILANLGISTYDMQSFIFIEHGKLYLQSTGALKVCKYLKGLWPLCYVFIIVPKFIRDGIYNWIAKNRYKWFGVKEQCMVPSSAIKSRFIN